MERLADDDLEVVQAALAQPCLAAPGGGVSACPAVPPAAALPALFALLARLGEALAGAARPDQLKPARACAKKVRAPPPPHPSVPPCL